MSEIKKIATRESYGNALVEVGDVYKRQLNLVLPVYNMIFAIGAMMGVGSAIRLVIERNQDVYKRQVQKSWKSAYIKEHKKQTNNQCP